MGYAVAGLIAGLLALGIARSASAMQSLGVREPAVERAEVAAQAAFYFDHLTPEDGLPSREVSDVVQDETGFIWFATRGGLARWDGYRFRVYDAATLRISTDVSALAVGEDGILWVGTPSGLVRFDTRSEQAERIESDAACSVAVQRIESGPTGVWFAAGSDRSQLCRVRGARTESVSLGGIAFQQAIRMLPSGDELIVSGSQAGATWWCSVRSDGAEACHPMPNTTAQHLVRIGRRLYALEQIGGELLAWRWDGAAWSDAYPVTRAATGAPVRGRQTVIGPRAWIPTVNGLMVLDTLAWSARYVTPDPADPTSLRGFTVRSILRDRLGAVWVAHEQGVSTWHTSRRRFAYYRRMDAPGSLADNRVNGLHEARDGALWVATNGGLYRRDPARSAFERVDRGEGEVPGAFWQVIEDRAGRVWAGSKGGALWRVAGSPGRYRLRREEAFPGGRGVRDLAEDRAGHLWAASGLGLGYRPSDSALWTDVQRAVPSFVVANVFYEGSADGPLAPTKWVGGDAGLYRLEGRALRSVPIAPASVLTRVWALAETPLDPGALYVGTVGAGLIRLRVETGQAEPLGLALPEATVFGILADETGGLWLSTPGGLVRYDPSTGTTRRYDHADGLPTDAFDLMSYHRGAVSGLLYFGGPEGLIAFDPATMAVAGASVPIVLTSTTIGGAAPRTSPRDTLRLPRTHGDVQLRFAALGYAGADHYRYRFRLRGFEQAWRTAEGPDPVAQYTQLPPGTYTFEVEGSTRGALPLDPAHRIVVVPARWYETAWARWAGGALGLLALLGLASLAAMSLSRRRLGLIEREQADALELRRRLAEARESERRRLARDLHDGPVQELHRLAHDLDVLGEAVETVEAGEAKADPRRVLAQLAGRVPAVRGGVSALAHDLRDVLRQLRSPVVEQLGLARALRADLRHFQAAHPHITFYDAIGVLPAEPTAATAAVVYRIAHEVLRNAVRHSDAQHVSVRLADEAGVLVLGVEDDGRGFHVPPRLLDLVRDGHFGLAGANERAEEAGGTLRVVSSEGAGTRVELRVPNAAA